MPMTDDDEEDQEPQGRYVPVSAEQFECGEDEVTHVPTGARFWAYPESLEPHGENWGRSGRVLDNGDVYEQAEIYHMACEFLRQRLGSAA